MTITPAAMPQKSLGSLRTKLLADLIDGKATTRTHKTLDVSVDDKGKRVETLVETKIPAGFGLRYPLARNVSEANVNIIAKRWMA